MLCLKNGKPELRDKGAFFIQYERKDRRRLSMKPGITCLWHFVVAINN
jgi:lipopolysaccharide/colanic/teichoic acid biosynthesis glycosyltransferase